MNYIEGLMLQENDKIPELKDTDLVFANEPPEDNPEGEQDIGYGHKITANDKQSGRVYGFKYADGITKDDARVILALDKAIHRGRAMDLFSKKEWEAMPLALQNLATDYSFTGTLHKFPKMFEALKAGDKAEVVKEYERKYTKDGVKEPMKRRNGFAMSLINQGGNYWKTPTIKAVPMKEMKESQGTL